MSGNNVGAADEPFQCLTVHVIYRGEKQRKKRYAETNEWVQAGMIPTDLPDWAEVTLNHGGGGGP